MGLCFVGYAAIFNRPDRAGEVIAPGAFQNSLRRHSDQIPMLYQHALSRPIGRWIRCFETEYGLRVEGALVEASQDGADVAALIRAGAVKGLSIGYVALKSHAGTRSIHRVLTEIDLIEISIVTIPLQPLACLEWQA